MTYYLCGILFEDKMNCRIAKKANQPFWSVLPFLARQVKLHPSPGVHGASAAGESLIGVDGQGQGFTGNTGMKHSGTVPNSMW
jgi:hypothetical protein